MKQTLDQTQKTAKTAKGSILLPIVALICSLVGFNSGWFAYFSYFTEQSFPFFGDALRELAPSLETLRILRCAGSLFFLAALVCGAIGLVFSVRGILRGDEKAKSIVGIVLSSVAIVFSFFGFFEVLMSIIML